MKKAVRHFQDALLVRSVRNDLDDAHPLVLLFYEIQTHPMWAGMLSLVSWIYLGFTFFEPQYAGDTGFWATVESSRLQTLRIIESIIISLFWIDNLLSIIHRFNDTSKPICERYFASIKHTTKLVIQILFLADFISFNVRIEDVPLRFSRFFRPINLFLYSKQLRRTVQAILNSYKKIFDTLLFFLLISVSFALIGRRVIGSIEGSDYDEYESNFKDFKHTFASAYIMLSAEGYPMIAYPALQKSFAYMIYFVPYLILSILVLIPIPIAVFFKAFSKHRSTTVILDRLREREALFACFATMTLDEEGGVLVQEKFNKLITQVYPGISAKVFDEEIFQVLDEDGSGSVELNEFFKVPEMILNNPVIQFNSGYTFRFWKLFCSHINRKLNMEKLKFTKVYQIIMLMTCLVSAVTFLIYLIDITDSMLPVLKIINLVVIAIQAIDTLIDIMGEGFYFYFSRPANLIDFVGYIVFYFVRISFSFFRIFRILDEFNPKPRKTAEQKYRRSATKAKYDCSHFVKKRLRFLLGIYTRLQNYIIKILICIPLVIKIIPVIFTAIYVYSLIGVELFNESKTEVHNSEYMPNKYTNFDNVGNSMISLFQIMVEQVWTQVFYDVADRFQEHYDFASVAAYFVSFYTINNIILLSLTEGLILEVFLVVDENIEVHNRIKTHSVDNNRLVVQAAMTMKRQLSEKIDLSKTNPGKEHTQQDFGSNSAVIKFRSFHSQKTYIDQKKTLDFGDITRKWHAEYGGNMDTEQKHTKNSQILDVQHTNPKFSQISENQTSRRPSRVPSDLTSNIDERGDLDLKLKAINFSTPITQTSINPSKTKIGIDTLHQIRRSDPPEREATLVKGGFLSQQNLGVDLRFNGFDVKTESPGSNSPIPKSHLVSFTADKSAKSHSSEENRSPSPESRDSKESKILARPKRKLPKPKTLVTILNSLSRVPKASEMALEYFQENTKLYEGKEEFALPADGKIQGTMIVQYDDYLEKKNNNDWDKFVSDLRPFKIIEIQDESPTHTRFQSTRNLSEKRKLISSSNSNQEFLLRKAFMKEVDQEEVQKIEEQHLKGMFGMFYNQLKNNPEDKKKLIMLVDILNRIVIQLLRINCESKVPNQIFCKVLYHMEETLNKKLLGGENLCKFLFKTVNGKWFTLGSNEGTDLNVSSVRAGPWQFADKLYTADGEIYCCKDVFDRENQKVKKGTWMDYFKTEFYNLWVTSSGAATREQLFDDSTWDLYTMCFENNSAAKVGGDLIKEFFDHYKAKIPAISSMTVERVLFVVFVKDQQKSTKKTAPDSAFNTLGDLAKFQSVKNSSFGHKQSVLNEVGKTSSNRRQSFSKKHEERRASFKMTMFNNHGHHDEGTNTEPRAEEDKLSLPFKEIIGMFRDFSRVILPYKLNVFRKVTYFLVGNKVDIEHLGKDNVSQIMENNLRNSAQK